MIYMYLWVIESIDIYTEKTVTRLIDLLSTCRSSEA